MPIRISVPGRGVAEFPDGTTYDQAFSSIQEEVPDFQPSREDTFASMRQKSEALAGPDKQRFLEQENPFAGFGGGVASSLNNFLEQSLGKSMAGAGSILAAGGRLLDMPLDSHYKAEEKAGRPVNRIEAKLRNPFQEAADFAATHEEGGKASQFFSDVVGGIAPSMTAGLLTGGFGAGAIAGAQQFGDTRKRVLDYYKQLGLPEYEAQNTADQLGTLSGAITGAVTKYAPVVLSKIPGIGKYLGEQGAEGLAKKLLIDRLKQGSVGEIAKRIVGNAAGEATEEGVNQFLLEVVESKQLEPNLTWQEVAKRTGMAAAQGAVGGAGVSAVGEGIRKGMDVAITAAYPNANQRYGSDAVREHAANQLAEMFGLPPVHEAPQPTAPRVGNITQEAKLLQQADTAFRSGQISQPEYQIAVDRFQQARQLERSQQVQQPTIAPQDAVQIEKPDAGLLRSQGQELGLPPVGQGNAQSQVTPGAQTQAQGPVQNEAQAPVVGPTISQPSVPADLGAGAASPQTQSGPETNAPAAISTADKAYSKPANINATVVSETKSAPKKRFKDGRIVAPESLPDSTAANNTEWFHGGKKGIAEPSSGFTAIDSLFGSGFYLTDDPEIANSYAKNRGGNSGALYSVKVNVGNVLNLEMPITQDVARAIKESIGDEFSGVVDNGLSKGASTASVIRGIQEAFAEHSAENNYPKSEYVEYWQNIESRLRESGYDAMTHVGGTRAGKNKKLHQVLILLDPSAELSSTDKLYSKTVKSISERIYEKLDEIDKSLSQNTYSSVFAGADIGVAKLVLKTAKLAIRAGQSVAEAVRGAIAKAKQQYPDSKFDTAAFEKSILADLQPLLSGQEEQSVIAQAAEPFVKANETAAAKLDQTAFTGVQLGKARQDLRDVRDQVVQLALAQGVPVSDIPSEYSGNLAEVAASLGGDAASIQDLQARINHEERARELHSLTKQQAELSTAEARLLQASPGKYADVLAYLAESKGKLAKKAASEKFDDVRDRAAELATQEAERISNTAKRDALQNGHVVEAIMGPVEEMRKLLEETPELQGRTAGEMLADPLVSDDTKQLFVIRMSNAFRAFDQSRENLESDLISSEQSLEQAIAKLEGKLSDARMDKAFADIVISDAGRAVKGETGLTGGLNPKWVEWYDNNQSALRSFARSLATATGQDAVTAQKLMDWIRFGVDASAMPELRNTAGHKWGVGDEVLNEIKAILLESKATRNAVALIYSAGNQKLAAHELRKIATAAAGGDEAMANDLFDKLVSKTESERAKLSALSRELASDLEAKRLELETLREAKLLFDRVATSPTFTDGRNAVEGSEQSFMQQFLLRKNDQMGLSGFKMPDGSEQPNLSVIGAVSGAPDFSKEAGNAILKWFDNAKSYVTQYEIAENDFESGSGPNPVQLGFDPAVYRGLKYTLTYEMPGILDGTLFHPETGVDYSGSNQLMQTWQWFRQIDATARLVKGLFGNNLRQAVAEFRDTTMLLGTVASDQRFNEIPKLLSAAMAAHPSVGGVKLLNKMGVVGKKLQERFAINGNLEKYRELVFNPMANIGRGFGTLKVGTVLHTGEVVTQADIDLLKRAQERDRALLKIAQRRGKGQSQQYSGKEFRREAGSVGDLGTPRHINNSGETFIELLARAATDLGRDTAFTWDQLRSGDHPILQAWRRVASNHFALNSHVQDSAYRTDRDVQVHPFMRQAYRNLAQSMEESGYLNKIDTVGELAERLVQHFPADTGFDPRTFVLEQLNNEFEQYNRNAIGYVGNIAKVAGESADNILANGIAPTRAKNSSIIETETSNNEFTKPAGTLKIPSAFYDYSSISPLDMALSKSRALGEKTVDMKNALRNAIQNAGAVLDTLKSNDEAARQKVAAELNLSVPEAIAYLETINDAMRGIDDALGRNYRKDNAAVATVKTGLGLMVGGALTSVGAAANNILAAPAAAFYLHGMINRAGAATLSLATAKYGARVARNFIYSAIHGVSEVTARDFNRGFDYLEKNAKPLARSLSKIAEALQLQSRLGKLSDYSGYAQFSSDVDTARQLGFSQPRSLFTQIGNSIRQSMQYVDTLEQESSQGALKQVGRAAALAVKIPTRAIGEALKFTLLELGDTTINASTLASMRELDSSLKDLAVKWASDRISKGMGFDPSNPEFLVRPDEYRKHGALGRLTSEDNLAHMRALAQMAGTNLEQMLWDYYNTSDKGSKDVSVFGQHEDSMRRVMIGAVNASTFTNRPLKAQTDTDIGVVQALTGFQTNMAIGILNAMKGSQRNAKTAMNRVKRLFEALGKVIAGIIAFMLVSTFSTGMGEWLNRKFAGKIARKMLPVDKEYWNMDAKLPWRIAKSALAIAPFLGSLGRLDEGIRPDVSGGIFAISAMNMIGNYVVGAMRLPAEDLPWLAKGMMRRIFPITQVAPLGDANGPNSPATKLSAGIASFAAATDAAGLTKPNLQGPASGMAPITAKTGMLSKLAEAGMAASIAERKGDAQGLAEANAEIEHQKNRLIDYHREQIIEDNQRRGIESSDFKVEKDAIAAARRDWSGMNPIARVLGHQPTQSEMDRIGAQLSGDRKAAADLAWDSFARMSDRFPTAKGATPPMEMVKTPRGGGSSRFGYTAPVALAAGGSRGGRRVSLRGSRTRLRGRSGLRTRSRGRGLRLRRR